MADVRRDRGGRRHRRPHRRADLGAPRSIDARADGRAPGGLLLSINEIEGVPGVPGRRPRLRALPARRGAGGARRRRVPHPTSWRPGARTATAGTCTDDGGSPPARWSLATGARLRALDVPGEERLRGKGVSHCASCDAPLLRDRIVGVVGGGDSALQEALTLADTRAPGGRAAPRPRPRRRRRPTGSASLRTTSGSTSATGGRSTRCSATTRSPASAPASRHRRGRRARGRRAVRLRRARAEHGARAGGLALDADGPDRDRRRAEHRHCRGLRRRNLPRRRRRPRGRLAAGDGATAADRRPPLPGRIRWLSSSPSTTRAASRRRSPAKPLAPRLESLDGKRVYLVDCLFDNSDVFMGELQRWFGEQLPAVETPIVEAARELGRRPGAAGGDRGRRRRRHPRRRRLKHL